MNNDLYREIVKDAAELVRRAAHPRRGTIALSPEAAAALEGIGSASAAGGNAQAGRSTPGLETREVSTEVLDELRALEQEVAVCTKCDLCQGRTQTVFADGSGASGLVFVGEAPGYHEDQQGIPFVGRGGELLTDIIVKGMKMRREDVYICNVIKCRPPENRDPTPEEKRQCEAYLVRQLELIGPKVICALGGHAAKTLLKTEESTGRLRGKWHFYQGIPLRVTYHPAYLLRSPSEKAKTWDDIQEVMKVLSGEVAPRPPAENQGLWG